LTFNTTTAGALIGLALDTLDDSKGMNSSSQILLLVPVTACLFGLLTLYQHTLVYDIGDYLKLIETRINSSYTSAMGWYTSSDNTRSIPNFFSWHLPIGLITIVPSLIALGLGLEVLGKDGQIGSGTIAWLTGDAILIIYFVCEYVYRVLLKRTYRYGTNKQWKQKLGLL
jgi:hypothetical protein